MFQALVSCCMFCFVYDYIYPKYEGVIISIYNKPLETHFKLVGLTISSRV